jgi:hypothetical membrane protein
MNRISTTAIVLFALTVLAGPLYTVDGYSSVSNLISELGAQNTRNNFIMITGFVILGLGIIIASLKKPSYQMIPIMLFGLFITAAGIFPHKPLDPTVPYNALLHSLHSASATLAGISICAAFIWQGVLSKKKESKIICFYLALISFAFPMLMLAMPEFQGLIQRLMYLQILGWLLVMHPEWIIEKTEAINV